MKQEGVRVFNLGHDGGDEGLARFKRRFGAKPVELEFGRYYLGSRLRKQWGTAKRLLRENPRRLIRALTGSVLRYAVFATDPHCAPAPPDLRNVSFKKLTDGELASLPELKDEASRAETFGFNNAYGALVDGRVVHVSWLFERVHSEARGLPVLGLREGEAEIGFCATLPEYRGRGIYPYALEQLCRIAASRGIRRILMFTLADNLASQRGILKAGFRRCGRTFMYVPPFSNGARRVFFRLFRLGI
jgi:RimJ/RimL family protein N-acetyltransferase